ncbi:MAG TPA: diphthine--ammonia ligase [Flavobacteriaceae bacterium]|nr:diphthine--ammonia ligase [Flavobacteriaceae bacterium]
MKIAFFNWSTGKDSALALYYMLQNNAFKVNKLITTISKETEAVTMHSVPKDVLLNQVKSIGIPLDVIEIPTDIDMQTYSAIMKEKLNTLKQMGYQYSIFGDIFLEDLQQYRIKKLNEIGLKAHFPLWKKDSHQLVNQFFSLGFKAVVVSVNANILDDSFVGVDFNEEFINRLPSNVDVCGENGEFHTFVYNGPIFKNPIPFKITSKVLKTHKSTSKSNWDTKFWYCSLTA